MEPKICEIKLDIKKVRGIKYQSKLKGDGGRYLLQSDEGWGYGHETDVDLFLRLRSTITWIIG